MSIDRAGVRAALAIAACVAGTALSVPARAHPGGLNSEGCHTNRKTGDYHCHRGGSTSRPSTPAPRKRQGIAGNNGVSFANCTEARAAGYSNIRRGEPGYAQHLDRDGDGVACERR